MCEPFYKPWVGANIEKRQDKRRIFFLGESHHKEDGEEDTPSFTIDVVTSYIENDGDSGGKRWHGFFTRCLHLLDGNTGWIPPDERERAWSELIFYNYIQKSLGPDYRGKSPLAEEWERAKKTLPCVLMNLKPTHIIVLGCRLWKAVDHDDDRIESVPAIGVRHPMGGLSYKKECPLVKEFLRPGTQRDNG